MGDGADYARECEERFGRTIWTQGDGTKINVKDMHDDHLNNARALVERRISEVRAEISGKEDFIRKNERSIKMHNLRIAELKEAKQMLFDEFNRRQKRRFEAARELTVTWEKRKALMVAALARAYEDRMKPTIVKVHVPKGIGRVRIEIVEDKE